MLGLCLLVLFFLRGECLLFGLLLLVLVLVLGFGLFWFGFFFFFYRTQPCLSIYEMYEKEAEGTRERKNKEPP